MHSDFPIINTVKAIGQVVFLRTDCAEYSEERVTFETLGELVQLCKEPKDNLILERVVIFSQSGSDVYSISLAFVSATQTVDPTFLLP